MESFAKHYCSQNPGIFDEPDTCYIVCFGIIMLNTVLHNSAVKMKTTEDDFISQFRGMNSGKDLDRSFLVRRKGSLITMYNVCIVIISSKFLILAWNLTKMQLSRNKPVRALPK